MTSKGIYIFDNETDFIQAIKEISNKPTNKPNVIYLSKKLETFSELRKEILFLNMFNIRAFNGYRTNKIIRICLSDNNKRYFHITYRFNAVTCGTVYESLNRYLKKRQNIYI